MLAPDYHSGNEVLAMRAAGATIHYYPIHRDMRLDPDEVRRLCEEHNPDVLYVIHYLGWPQPMPALVDLCRQRGMLLVEDCALALLSELDGRPLGSFGDWSVFCLYKTLPVPNGAVLVQNTARLDALERLPLRQAGSASVLGRTAELLVQRTRGRTAGLGAALCAVKRGPRPGRRRAGRPPHAGWRHGIRSHRRRSGDVARLGAAARSPRLRRHPEDATRANFRRLADALRGRANLVLPDLDDGVCPLFFPVLVADKHAAATALRQRGVDALEFWNDGVERDGAEMSADARFLRAHVLELPIHQDLTAAHVDYIARQASTLNLRMAA